MTILMASSYTGRRLEKKAVTVRVPAKQLRKLMRARRATSQSELINALLSEEEERIEAERVLRETAGSAAVDELDDRLL